MINENPYYKYFQNVKGRGDGSYYTGIGEIYKTKRGIQKGYGYFVPGKPFDARRGLGFGSVMKSFFNKATPVLKEIGNRTLNVISNVAKDAIHGNNITDSLMKEGKTAVGTLMKTVPQGFAEIFQNKKPKRRYRELIPDSDTEDETSPAIKKKKQKLKNFVLKKNKRYQNLRSKYPGLQYF